MERTLVGAFCIYFDEELNWYLLLIYIKQLLNIMRDIFLPFCVRTAKRRNMSPTEISRYTVFAL